MAEGGRGIVTSGQGVPAFPFVALKGVIEMAEVLGPAGGRCQFNDLAELLGQTKTSGAFRGRTMAGRMFGVTETEGSEVVLTELGRRICSPDTAADARADAFLNVPLYKALFNRYAADGFKLPPAQVVESDMMRLGVPDTRVAVARQTFMRSAETAGYFRSGHDRLIRPAPMSGSITPRNVGMPERAEPAAEPPAEAAPMAEHPLIQGLMAKLPPEGDRFTPRQRQRWLDTAKAALDLMYAGEDEDDPDVPVASMNGAAVRHPAAHLDAQQERPGQTR